MSIRITTRGLHDISWWKMGLRFLFGGIISVVAGVVTLNFGNRAGGLFLAFPSILPAALTFLEEKDGKRASVSDVSGAVFGAAGLVAFAVVLLLLVIHTSGVVALGIALAGWTLTSFALYLCLHDIGPWHDKE